MATGTLSQFDALAREVYPFGSKIFDQMNRGTPGLDVIESGNKVPFNGKYEGRKVFIPVRTRGNSNTAVGTGEQGSLPSGSVSSYDKLIYNVATLTSALQMTALSMDTLDGGERSVANVLPTEMEQHKKDARFKLGAAIHGDGSGIIGVCNASQTSINTRLDFAAKTNLETVQIDDEIIIRDLDAGTLATGWTAGQPLVVTAKSGSLGTTPYVSYSAYKNGTTPSLSGVNGNFGAYYYDSQGDYVIGFGAYCDDGNPDYWGSSTAYVGNINRDTAGNEWWQAYRHDAGADAIDLVSDIQVVLDKVNERAGSELGGDDFLVGFVRYANWRNLGNQLSKDQWTDGRPKKLTGGWEEMEYENLVFVRDRLAPPDKIRIVNPKMHYRYIVRPWFWNDMTGAIWRQQTSSVDGRDVEVYKAYMHTRQQMCAKSCLANAEIYNISASS